MTDNFIPMYDLESLTETQRQDYIRNVCKHMGVPDNLNLVALTYIDDGDGPSRLVPYAKRGATENVRNNLQIEITSLTNQMIGGSIVFTAIATSKKLLRQEISTGSKFIEGLTGTALDDAIMASQTRALRRVTLQFIGAGVLDESEVNQRKLVQTLSAPIQTVPQPVAPPSNEPGKDATPEPSAEVTNAMSLLTAMAAEPFYDEAKRLQAIEQLNAQAEPKVKKTRKKRSVNLGPSEPPVTVQSVAVLPEPVTATLPATTTAQTVGTTPAPERAVGGVNQTAPLTAPVVKRSKLNPDQVKPFRQRLFSLRNDYLEPAGLAPKEGMGIADQMRALAQVMFADIADMNDLDEKQWEKYLSVIESKVKNESPASAVKFIEETIGL